MIVPLVSNGSPLVSIQSRAEKPRKIQSLNHLKKSLHCYCQQQYPPNNSIEKHWSPKTQFVKPVILSPDQIPLSGKANKTSIFEEKNGSLPIGSKEMWALCGFGYWVDGFKCFPWLALNFHMAHTLNMSPSILQVVQNSGNLPMVAKPFYGILSDTLYIGGARRIPYLAIGVFLQVMSWGSLALIPVASQTIPALMACVLLSNLGASIAEVAKDSLVAEYGQKNKIPGLQSYAFMALAAGGILGNLLGGFFLLRTQQTETMFERFALLLILQLALTSAIREENLGLVQSAGSTTLRSSFLGNVKKQVSDLMVSIRDESILRPLFWITASILTVPVLSGSIFCYQTQCLYLDPSVIGMSKVTGQLILLAMSILYDRFGKGIPMRKLIGAIQLLYAFSLVLDLVLVKQINLTLGIPNEVFVLCFSGLAETLAQVKLLPFYIHFGNLASPGCEGSLMSFVASLFCLSSIVGGFLGVGLASLLGITSGDYSRLPLGILIQFVAALLPLRLIHHVPMMQPLSAKDRKGGRSKRTRRYRRVGRVILGSLYSYRRERESDLQR